MFVPQFAQIDNRRIEQNDRRIEQNDRRIDQDDRRPDHDDRRPDRDARRLDRLGYNSRSLSVASSRFRFCTMILCVAMRWTPIHKIGSTKAIEEPIPEFVSRTALAVVATQKTVASGLLI